MKIFYLFDSLTGEFTGTYEAHESPLEPGKFIAPVYSTANPLPTLNINEAAIRVLPDNSIPDNGIDGDWVIVPNYRGESWYDSLGNITTIDSIGIPAIELSRTLPPAIALKKARDEQKRIVTGSYINAIQQPVVYMNTFFQADDRSYDALVKVLTIGSVPYWLDLDNVQVPMTLIQLQGLAIEMLNQRQVAYDKLQTLKNSINIATDVTAIVW